LSIFQNQPSGYAVKKTASSLNDGCSYVSYASLASFVDKNYIYLVHTHKLQNIGSSSYSHAINPKSSRNGLMDDNPWGVGQFANMEIEEVNHPFSKTPCESFLNSIKKRDIEV
jgi:hypothetical protein